MDKKYLNASEVSKLIQLNEKKIYKLAQEGKIPATKITGKWLFPVEELEQFLNQNALNNLAERYKSHTSGNILLFAGSDDPVGQSIFSKFASQKQDMTTFYSKVGSFKGVSLVSKGLTHVALAHILNPANGKYNTDYLKNELTGFSKFIILNFFKRDMGFISKEGIKSFREISERKLRFINRPTSTGTRALTESKMKEESVESFEVPGFENEAYSHFEVAKAIAGGDADAGISSPFYAEIFNLKFSKIITESFDMILTKDTFFTAEFQTFLDFIKSDEIKNKISSTPGYSSEKTGNLII